MDSFGAVTPNFNDSPQDACRPFDRDRSGTVLSDGGGMLLLESLECATKRKAEKIYGEIAGFGIASDAFHALRPTDSGVGLIKAIQLGMIEAGIQPSQIDAFNCHATSTAKGDSSEARCIASILSLKDITNITAQQISEIT